MLGFVCCILLMTLGKAEFRFKDIWKTFLCFAVMFLWGALLNFVIFPGSDYMYMVNDPLELDIKMPYQILYVIILIVYTCVWYIHCCIERKENDLWWVCKFDFTKNK